MDDQDLFDSDPDRDAHTVDRPAKRARYSSPSSSAMHNGNRSSRSPGGPLPLLSPSIIGVEPLDEFIREIADFIHYTISTRPPDAGGAVEVEAKIGVLKDRSSGQRIQLPVLVETILQPNGLDMRFESNMTGRQHQHFNKLLNQLKLDQPALEISYEHLHLLDNFFAPEGGGRGEKIRVTRDEKTGQVRACVRKVRLADLNIFCPKRAVDWRVSVNLEIPVPPPIGTPSHSRRKDRMSYTHQEFVVDLTQVTATAGPGSKVRRVPPPRLRDSDYLLSSAAKRGDPALSKEEQGAFDDLIHAFVNNARILCRNAPNDGPAPR
ncbi:mRNA triphosphatase CET1 [Epithele typhae]|uniref:mRNA triphosphatase CET1 n=1 Tax=Epithele typhae TaxID=378194 RepID=UPI0020088412|nr:mRNA triphosphatase CET1 [Epithele typhae]KAH9925358.1 mRNA triphosphatase CET1 [Epithele typhae]